mmetsp:Transcript_44591/g.66171  ORF Transcript_44591/g.66171 Transcript_44591/m.66171 type:complete len:110 (-) Transcript_44591:1159-1488(-)
MDHDGEERRIITSSSPDKKKSCLSALLVRPRAQDRYHHVLRCRKQEEVGMMHLVRLTTTKREPTTSSSLNKRIGIAILEPTAAIMDDVVAYSISRHGASSVLKEEAEYE